MVPSIVRIMLANHKSCFAEVRLEEGDTISSLVGRACSRFPSWNADPAQVYLYLVSVEQARTIERDPSSASDVCMLGHALFSGDLLDDAGVLPSSYLLALKCDGAFASTYCPTSIALNKSQAPTRMFERYVARHLESILKDINGIRLELGGLTELVKNLAAAVRDK